MTPRDFTFMVSALALVGGVLTAIFLSIAAGIALAVVAVLGLVGAQVITTEQPPRRQYPVIRPREVGRDWDAERDRRDQN